MPRQLLYIGVVVHILIHKINKLHIIAHGLKRGLLIRLAWFFKFYSAFFFVVVFRLGLDDFSITCSSSSCISSTGSSSGCSDNFISTLFFFNTSSHFTIFFISLVYTLSKSISGYTFSK